MGTSQGRGREAVSTPAAPAAIGPYSQAIRAGALLFVSGQIPIDPATGTLVDGDIAAQTHRVFNTLRDGLGWVNRGAHDAPRLHDLRHTFAVRRLMLWHAEGADVDQMMLALSTYMGHAKIRHYWYLTAAPELMALAGDKFERFANHPGGCDE